MTRSPCGGIVLCGGESTRMGWPKANLPFGPELMLQRVVRLLREVVQPIVSVAAADQSLPPLPLDVLVARDEQSRRGPLQGLLAGLTAIAPYANAAFVTSCDVPLLAPAFIRRMIELLREDDDVVVAKEDRFHHPLAAVYRTTVTPRIAELLQADRLRPLFLFELVRTREIPVEMLRGVDAELRSLRNINHPEEYLEVLAAAGFQPDPEIVARLRLSRNLPDV